MVWLLQRNSEHLSDLLNTSIFDLDSMRKLARDVVSVSMDPIEGSSNDTIPRSNAKLVGNKVCQEIYSVVKPHLLQLGEDAQLLRMWVMMSIPKIEDGNNFGVSVQEEVLMEASRTEGDVTTMLDFYCDYLVYRGKLSTKRIKWPGVMDYTEALADLDETICIRLRMALQDIRNNYARLYDLFMKNITKIRNPRSDAMDGVNLMY